MKNKVISKILGILLVILVVLIIILSIANYITKSKYKDRSVHDLSNILSFTNSLTDIYNGDVPSYKISSRVQMLFETYLPMISDEIVGKSDSELSKYFEKDSERIYLNTGIKNKQEFVEFAKGFQNLNCTLSEFKELTYLENSYKNINSGEESIQIKVKYKNNIELQYKVYIQKVNNDDCTIKLEYIK